MDENSRQSHVITAKFAEQAERYDDMVSHMESVVRLGEPLSPDERNLLSVAYKNVVGALRSACRILDAQESEHMNSDGTVSSFYYEYKMTIKGELEKRCRDVLNLLDEYLIKPTTSDDEIQVVEQAVFYRKMKGDYFRYLVEITPRERRDNLALDSKEAYENATELAECLPTTNPIRLGLALNFSVFYYEMQSKPKMAVDLAKKAFDAAISELDNLRDDSYKDSTLIMQLLRDNITLWTPDE